MSFMKELMNSISIVQCVYKENPYIVESLKFKIDLFDFFGDDYKNKVHEVLEGHREHAFLPQEEDFCFYHPKGIEKQQKQNEFYGEI